MSEGNLPHDPRPTPGRPPGGDPRPTPKRPKDSEFFELPPNLAAGPPKSPPIGSPAFSRPESGLRPSASLDVRAVIALVAAVVGVPASWPMAGALFLPAAALGLGVVAVLGIRKSGGKLMGTQLAQAAVLLGAATLLVMGLLHHALQLV
ncbi:MAG: hypothetical protein L0216_14165 [Planctomycetales bacterium]|nr:hypothetical protein [Planctomycetales bacterium]